MRTVKWVKKQTETSWIAELTDGRMLYMVTTPTMIKIAEGKDLTSAYLAMRSGGFDRVRQNTYKDNIDRDALLKFTGIQIEQDK